MAIWSTMFSHSVSADGPPSAAARTLAIVEQDAAGRARARAGPGLAATAALHATAWPSRPLGAAADRTARCRGIKQRAVKRERLHAALLPHRRRRGWRRAGGGPAAGAAAGLAAAHRGLGTRWGRPGVTVARTSGPRPPVKRPPVRSLAEPPHRKLQVSWWTGAAICRRQAQGTSHSCTRRAQVRHSHAAALRSASPSLECQALLSQKPAVRQKVVHVGGARIQSGVMERRKVWSGARTARRCWPGAARRAKDESGAGQQGVWLAFWPWGLVSRRAMVAFKQGVGEKNRQRWQVSSQCCGAHAPGGQKGLIRAGKGSTAGSGRPD